VQSLNSHQRFFVAGRAVELWEDPEFPFGLAFDDLEAYCLESRWELLFNAIVLACLSRLDADEEELRQPSPPWAWAFAAEAAGAPEDGGH
jgi:hypothetical protein